MFFIEKNDKPNFFEKRFNILKIKNNTIFIPVTSGMSERQIEKIAIKTKKIIRKNTSSKKVILSKEIKKEEKYINYLYMYNFDIQNGKFLFELLLPEITEYIINKKSFIKNKCIISILINDLTEIEYENIKLLARQYKTINIVTNHIEKFKNLEEKLYIEEGIVITITNNKKKSLLKSDIILNIDFTKELINKYNINTDAVIVNVKEKIKINKKRFNGISINNYEINYRDDKKNLIEELNKRYCLKDIYESQLYKKQRINDIRKKIKNDKVIIEKLILNNGVY